MLNLVLINDWGLHMGLFCSCEVQKMGRDRMILALTVAECCSYFSLFEIGRLILNLVLIVMPGLIARLHLAASAPMLCWVCPLFFYFFYFFPDCIWYISYVIQSSRYLTNSYHYLM